MSLERRRRLVRLAAERELLVLEDNPYGLLRYEGDPLPPLYALDGGEYVIYLGTFSKILAPGLRLGWTAAPRPVLEKLNLGKQGADLCSSTFGQHFVIEYFAQPRLARSARFPARALPAPPRHDARRAGRAFPARGRVDAARRRPLHLGDAAATTSTRPTFSRARCASMSRSSQAAPHISTGAAGRAMRLNFSGVGEDDLREGVARIGKVVSEQVRSVLDAHRHRAGRAARAAARERQTTRRSARIVPLRRRAG